MKGANKMDVTLAKRRDEKPFNQDSRDNILPVDSQNEARG